MSNVDDNDPIDALLGEDSEPELEAELEAAPEVEPPADVEPQAELEEEKPRSETVPIGALHEERERRKELQEELQTTRDRMTRMETLWEQMQNMREPEPAPQPQLPDPDLDPDGFRDAKIVQLEEELNKIRGVNEERWMQEAQNQESQQLLERYAADVRRFSGDHGDFNDAYAFLGKSIDNDLLARGYDDPAERAAAIQYEEGMLVGRALRSGKSPAELIYNYAKSRGYAPANGAESDENKIERIQKGQATSRTLTGTQARGESAMTLERLAELADSDPDAFDKEWARAQRAGLLG